MANDSDHDRPEAEAEAYDAGWGAGYAAGHVAGLRRAELARGEAEEGVVEGVEGVEEVDEGGTYWTGLCTACGDNWHEDERPSVCPECGFTGVVAVPPGGAK